MFFAKFWCNSKVLCEKLNKKGGKMEKNYDSWFAGTFLEGWLNIKESEFIEPAMPLRSDDVVIDKMHYLEKSLFTLSVRTFNFMREVSIQFFPDVESLLDILNNYSDDLMMRLSFNLEAEFNMQGKNFSWEAWNDFNLLIAKFFFINKMLEGLIYSRLAPRVYCPEPQFRSGFLIIKSLEDAMEQDTSDEDYEKISRQNPKYN